MKGVGTLGRIETKQLGYVVLVGCLLGPVALLSALKRTLPPTCLLRLETTNLHFASPTDERREEESIKGEVTTILNAFKQEQGRNESIPGRCKLCTIKNGHKEIKLAHLADEATTASSLPSERGDNADAGFEMAKLGERELAEVDIAKGKPGENGFMTGNLIQQSKLICDYSGQRSDTCIMDGDVKVLGNNSTIILFSSSGPTTSPESTTWKIRPYARKWEAPIMAWITEITLKSSADTKQTPHCAVNHGIPAVVFSTGGFLGNLFHDFNDVLIPLFVTSRRYDGEVRFLVTNYNPRWINKYQPILSHLSHYQVINMDTDERVHCFPYAHVGLQSDKVLGIDPSKTPNGYSMADFREFLRACFSLNRQVTKRINKQSRKKPRLLILLRKGSRSFTNEREVIAMARRVGYKVITAGPEETKDLRRFTQIVNSCDVMMGVHGAGLTNMVFLPSNATLIQIIPWGRLTWACRHDYGEPVPDMGIRYLEYEIGEEESSLIAQYPRDHAVFKDPLSIHKQGFNAIWSVFLNKQKVKLNVNRFRGVLLEVFQSLKL